MKLSNNQKFIVSLLLEILFIYLVFSLSRVAIYFFDNELFKNLTNIDLIKYIFVGFRFDTVTILYLFSIYLILEILFNINSKLLILIKKLFFAIPLIVAIVLNIIDIISFKFNLRRTSYDMMFEYKDEDGKLNFVINFIKTNSILTLFLILLIAVVVLFIKKQKSYKVSIKYRAIYFIVFIPIFILGVRGGVQRRPISITTANFYTSTPIDANIVLNTPFVIMKTIGKKSIKKVHLVSDSLENSLLKTIFCYDSLTPNKKNVVFFIMESFSKEFIGGLNRDKKDFVSYTPFLDSLIKKSYTFKYSFANGRKSLDALPSTLLSIPELSLHYAFSQYSTNSVKGVGGCLKYLGYNTLFCHGGVNGTMQFDSFSKLCGFDNYYGKSEYDKDNPNNKDFDGVWGIWDDQFFQYSLKKFSTQKKPFMGVIYSLSSHHPYHIPAKYRDKFKGSNILEIHKTIQYSDYCLKRFFENASKQSWYKNTIFIITSDHVAAQKNRKEYLNSVGYFSVPIIIFTPDSFVSPKYDTTTIAEQIDIPATILYLTGYNKPFFSFGKNLFSPHYNHAITYLNNNYQLIGKDYLITYNLNNKIEKYNLSKYCEPIKKVNIDSLDLNNINFLKAFIQKYNNSIIDNELKP